MCIRGSFIGTLLAKDYLIVYHSCINRQTRPQGGLDAVRKKGWGSLGEGCPFLFSQRDGFPRAITRLVWYTRTMKLEAPELKENIADAVQEYANQK